MFRLYSCELPISCDLFLNLLTRVLILCAYFLMLRFLLLFIRQLFLNCQILFYYGEAPCESIYLIVFGSIVYSHVICLLTICSDFLTRSYDIGGVISVMALSSLYILMTQHGLEYPNFYEKLYALLAPSIFMTKHRAKFFEVTFYWFYKLFWVLIGHFRVSCFINQQSSANVTSYMFLLG